MSSINNILKRLRESRIQEAQSHEYKFDIPYRLEITSESDYNPTYQYNPKQMDYLPELEDKAMEDFNEIDWTQYTGGDRRTEDCGIISMSMSFTDGYNCIITVTTNQVLGQDKIDNIISYLTGQMSDGWGEGFEQREIATFDGYDEEWVEDEESDEGGYYEEVNITYYVYGQFWWASSETHPYQIELVGTPAEVGEESTNESKQSIVTLNIDEDKLEAAMKANGYYKGEDLLEFIFDVYRLEDGEDFQVGNGYELLFYSSTPREKIDKIFKELGEDIGESTDSGEFYVIDNTDTRDGSSEKYRVTSQEEAEKKIKELVDAGSDEDKITITPIKEASDGRVYTSVEYTYNGDDMSDYLGHVKVNTGSEERALIAAEKYAMKKHPEDEPRHFTISKDEYTNVDIIDFNGNIVESLAESTEEQDSIANELRIKIKDAVKKFMMSPMIGFPEEEVDEYSKVDVEYLKDNKYGNTFKIEVRAELSYRAISDLCDELNPIVVKYDKDTYFEPEQPGIITAYLAI